MQQIKILLALDYDNQVAIYGNRPTGKSGDRGYVDKTVGKPVLG